MRNASVNVIPSLFLFTRSRFVLLWACMSLAIALASQSVRAEDSALEVVEKLRDGLVSVISDRSNIEQQGGPDAYYQEVQGVFSSVVDFDFIARGVMGNHAKNSTPEQRTKFAKTLEFSLMNTVTTYTRGLTKDYQMVVVPPEGDVSAQGRVSIVIEVRTGEDKNELAFQMRKTDEGEWKLSNLILNGINLGVTFRSQFAQAMKKNPDIDAVIAGWSV